MNAREQVRREIRLRVAEAAAKAGRIRSGWGAGFPTPGAHEARGQLANYQDRLATEWGRVLAMVEAMDAGNNGCTRPHVEPECSHGAWEQDTSGRPVECADCGHYFTHSESVARWASTDPGGAQDVARTPVLDRVDGTIQEPANPSEYRHCGHLIHGAGGCIATGCDCSEDSRRRCRECGNPAHWPDPCPVPTLPAEWQDGDQDGPDDDS